MTENLRTYANIHQKFTSPYQHICEEMQLAVHCINVDEDIKLFIDRNKSGKTNENFPFPQSSTPPNLPSQNPAKSEQGNGPKVQTYSTELKHVKALYDYTGTDENELSFRTSDVIIILATKPNSLWWQGELNGKIGIFPSNYVVDCSEETTSAIAHTTPSLDLFKLCWAIYDYDSISPEELSMKVGEEFSVVEEDGTGWLFVYNEAGLYGRIPGSYVRWN